jgi:hypothetical protein
MNLKALLAACVGGVLIAANADTPLPSGWQRQSVLGADRACTAGTDATLGSQLRRSLTVECSRITDGSMSVLQTISADEYRGKRMRFAARVRADEVRGWGGLFMRVSTADARVLAFDDMSTRPLRGSLEWRDVQVILDVDPNASSISFGLRLSEGSGQLWAEAFRFEEVAPDDPSISINLRPLLPSKPQNLELE